MKFPNGVEIVSMEKRHGSISMQSKFGANAISFDPKLPERVQERIKLVSQWAQTSNNDNFNYQRVDDILPREEDAISVSFRSLSKRIIEGHWLDFTADGVLEAGVEMLQGQTVYPNHQFWDINNALGSVSAAAWDASGEKFGNVPGINATYSIDALMNPRIARGLLWKPFPYIHSTSLTVLFEFDYSHPRLVEEGKFWINLGEEIDGDIVRLVVTKIREIWEASLVFQGADRIAKKAKDDDDPEIESFSAANLSLPTNSNEEKTMKLTKEQKSQLGIGFDGEDVPETEIFKAAETLAARNKEFDGVNLTELKAQAATAATLLSKQRTEVSRLAKLAELGAEAGELDEIVSTQIEKADADTLVKLETYYQKKAAERFPTMLRSSSESSLEVEAAGGVKKEADKPLASTGGLV